MPLLLADLDNTLIDRAAAFRLWAFDMLREKEADPALVDEMIRIDGDGLRPKPEVQAELQSLLGLEDAEAARIPAVLRRGVLDHLVVDPRVLVALDRARSAGWTPFVVTNGVVPQQDLKITNLGIDEHIAGWVVSDVVGVRKPDPRIFRIAAERAGCSLEGAWMIGDAPDTDILGAQRAGIRSVYLRRGRAWAAGQEEPTAFADSFPEAVEIVLAAS